MGPEHCAWWAVRISVLFSVPRMTRPRLRGLLATYLEGDLAPVRQALCRLHRFRAGRVAHRQPRRELQSFRQQLAAAPGVLSRRQQPAEHRPADAQLSAGRARHALYRAGTHPRGAFARRVAAIRLRKDAGRHPAQATRPSSNTSTRSRIPTMPSGWSSYSMPISPRPAIAPFLTKRSPGATAPNRHRCSITPARPSPISRHRSTSVACPLSPRATGATR